MRSIPIRHIINPHSDEENAIRDLTITIQALVIAAVIAISLVVSINKTVILILAGLMLVTLVLAWRGLVSPAQVITPIAIAAVSTIFMLDGNGLHDIAIIGLAGSIIIAGLFLGSWGTVTSSIAAALIMASIGMAEFAGVFNPPAPIASSEDIVISAVIFVAIGLSLQATLNRLKKVASKARANEIAQVEANQELLHLKSSLETRVAERTADLERRAAQLETVSSVAHSITAVQDLDLLLPSICQTVSERFGVYHTGIFLIDERGEYAILQAANSEGGQKMLKRGHRLRVGASGIVGAVAEQGKARIALDVGADAAFFDNPDLPETRSEIALPLIIGSQIVGILDVQSRELDAFKEEDIAVLGILANQVSTAIENARLFRQTKQSLADSQSLYQQFIKQDWARFERTVKHTGYSYDGIKTAPVEKTTSPATQPNAVNVPIKIRGLTVGNVTIQSSNSLRTWSQGEINLAEAAAERAGLAIENFRLLNEAQRRAAKEHTVGEITAHIGASVDVREIMQIAVEELGRTLAGAEITLQLQNQEEN